MANSKRRGPGRTTKEKHAAPSFGIDQVYSSGWSRAPTARRISTIQAQTSTHLAFKLQGKSWTGIPHMEAVFCNPLSISHMAAWLAPRCEQRISCHAGQTQNRWTSSSTADWQYGQFGSDRPLVERCVRSAVSVAPCRRKRKEGWVSRGRRRNTVWSNVLSTLCKSTMSLRRWSAFRKRVKRMSSRKACRTGPRRPPIADLWASDIWAMQSVSCWACWAQSKAERTA